MKLTDPTKRLNSAILLLAEQRGFISWSLCHQMAIFVGGSRIVQQTFTKRGLWEPIMQFDFLKNASWCLRFFNKTKFSDKRFDKKEQIKTCRLVWLIIWNESVWGELCFGWRHFLVVQFDWLSQEYLVGWACYSHLSLEKRVIFWHSPLRDVTIL